MIQRFEIKRKRFNHSGLSLSYLDNEQVSNEPPILLLHGFTASAEMNWLETGWIDTLTKQGRRVLALDARGHGESDKPHDSAYYPARIMMEDSMALLHLLNIEYADYAGFSMGARMSTFAAMRYPQKVRKLLIGGLGEGLKTGIGNPQPIAEALRTDTPNLIKDRAARRFRRIAEKYANDLEAMACCITSSRDVVTDENLAKITANTLILVGEDDTIGGSPYQLELSIKNSQARVVKGCNHFNSLSHENFRQIGLKFLLNQ